MKEQFERTALLLGAQAMERLAQSRVAVFGLGGVGGYAAEALIRSGLGAIDLIDSDRVSLSNLNRQIFATHETVGQYKVDAAEERLLQIAPDTVIRKLPYFYCEETDDRFDLSQYDYVIDAIDTVSCKLTLVQRAQAVDTPIISSMGTGNKMDPAALAVSDISKTTVCPLARIMRKELRKRGIKHLKVVYSKELPLPAVDRTPSGELPPEGRRAIPGSNAFVPCSAGLLIAAEVVRDLTGVRGNGLGI